MARIDMSRLKQRAKKGLAVVDDLKNNFGHRAKKMIDETAYKAKSAVKKLKS